MSRITSQGGVEIKRMTLASVIRLLFALACPGAFAVEAPVDGHTDEPRARRFHHQVHDLPAVLAAAGAV